MPCRQAPQAGGGTPLGAPPPQRKVWEPKKEAEKGGTGSAWTLGRKPWGRSRGSMAPLGGVRWQERASRGSRVRASMSPPPGPGGGPRLPPSACSGALLARALRTQSAAQAGCPLEKATPEVKIA